MKFVLKLADRQIFYDEKNISIDGNICATYNDSNVTWLADCSVLAKFKHYPDHTWTVLENSSRTLIEAHDRDKTLRNLSYNKVIGTYTGPHAGALASYIAYTHSLTVPAKPKPNVVEQQVKPADSPKAIHVKKETILQEEAQQVPPAPEKKYISPKQEIPKIEKIYEEPPVYMPPKQEYEYKKPDFTPPPAPIPSGGSEESVGCIGPIGGLLIALVILIIAIKLIPQSWKDLPTYLADGDIGITISFYSSLIGGVLAIFRCIYDKESKISSALSTFLITCGIGVAINVFILFKDIFAGDYEFTGFILFDLPLAVFAPILGCFQFAFPIGIGVLIICGIICLVKKNS